MRNRIMLAIVCWICAGCVEPTASTPNVPAAPATYEPVNFQKLVNPAFSSSYYGKGVSFRCKFMGQSDSTLHLPVEFQKGYVNCAVSDESGKAMFIGFIVPKDRSDVVFNSALMSLWDVKARAIGSTDVGDRRGDEDSVVLLADKITPVTE